MPGLGSYVLICSCGWKIVTDSPDIHREGHVKNRKCKRPSFVVEQYHEEHPTMTHADAERIGHCWHAEAEKENVERDAASDE